MLCAVICFWGGALSSLGDLGFICQGCGLSRAFGLAGGGAAGGAVAGHEEQQEQEDEEEKEWEKENF